MNWSYLRFVNSFCHYIINDIGRIVAFDVVPLLNGPFDERYQQLIETIPRTHPFLVSLLNNAKE